MRVFLIRHAEAHKAAPGEPDALRRLTGEGQRQARELGRRLAGQPDPPTLVVTSPLLRARETGELIAEAIGVELRVDERLAPGATASTLTEVASDAATEPLAAVAHQPDCSEIAIALAGRDPGFPPAGTVELVVTR